MALGANKAALLGAAGSSTTSTFTIDQSIRYNDDDSPILKKTYSSAGTEETFTLSMWVKRGGIGAGLGASNLGLTLFSGGADVSNYGEIVFRSSGHSTQDCLEFYNSTSGSTNMMLKTNRLFRDPSAWMHLVFVMDTTNAVSSERLRMYINGVRETSFATATYPAKDTVPNFNTATEHGIGGFAVGTDTRFFDGYLAEIVFLDGTATDCNSFGEYSDDGIWIPKDVSGLTFGTNGFYIDGRDSSDLGDDESGQGNDFTASGLAAHDQVLDTPTNNFAVYNILYNVGDVDFPIYSEGNLSVDFNFFGKRSPVSTFALPTDSDAYCEFYIKTSASSVHNSGVGIGQGDANNAGNVALTNGVTYNFNGNKHTGDGTATSFGNTYTAGDIIGVYFDQSDNEVDFYKNNTLEGSLSLSSYSGDLFFLVANNVTSQQVIIANFGQDDTFAGNKTSGSAGASDSSGNGKFYYTRISGAKALCSKSLGS